MFKRVLKIGLFLTAGLGLAFVWYYPDQNLRVIMCDVGQGDSILITRGFSQVVIDGGPNETVLSCLGKHMPFWDRQIEMVVMTHPQADHMTGLVEVLKRYRVGVMVADGVRGEGKLYDALVSVLIQNHIQMLVPKTGDRIDVGGMGWEVWWPGDRVGGRDAWEKIFMGGGDSLPLVVDGLKIDDLNQVSVVMELVYGDFKAVFTGDLGEREELALTSRGVTEGVVLLKVPHHGSKYSSSAPFLEVVKPRLAVISVGKKNSFGHPSSDTLMRLDAVGAKVLRTDELGDVVVVTDGRGYWLEGTAVGN